MSRIQATFDTLKSRGRKALIPYVMSGFPQADVTPDLMHRLVSAGADVIELGVPFSDPMADGPVIQKAGEAALRLGIGTTQVLEMVRRFREQDARTPVVLMGSPTRWKVTTCDTAPAPLCETPLRQVWTAC